MLYLKSATNLCVIWHHTCISYKAFDFLGPGKVCGCGCGKIIKKRTRGVWECAEWKAIVHRVCECAKIGCKQILCKQILCSFVRFLNSCKITFQKCAKKGSSSEKLGIKLLFEWNEDFFCYFQSFMLGKLVKKWKKKLNLKRNWCVLGLSNIWSNRGRSVSIIEIYVPNTKMSLSQHFRTTFKSNFTYFYLSEQFQKIQFELGDPVSYILIFHKHLSS